MQKVSSAEVSQTSMRRGREETRTRPRIKCKPPRSIYLSREYLTSTVTAPVGIVDTEMLLKMTDSQLLDLRRQASHYQTCANVHLIRNVWRVAFQTAASVTISRNKLFGLLYKFH